MLYKLKPNHHKKFWILEINFFCQKNNFSKHEIINKVLIAEKNKLMS